MKEKSRKLFWTALCLLAAFAVWTAMVCTIDVRPAGPRGSEVGFCTVNQWVHGLFGVHMSLYVVTDWLGLVPVGIAFGFAVLGLVQWISRKKLLKVDHDILALGVFYLVVMAVYLLFEEIVINYRPVLIEGFLEASYPSSTTILASCVMPTAGMQIRARVRNRRMGHVLAALCLVFLAFMVIGRLISGVHWFSDIVGGLLLSGGLVAAYASFFVRCSIGMR
ncbi:MAG: phosphatase PAP2 family protein [Clostridia bacterium]|nr:phosphatase PAP2 family protein [Clostridia bacterium]